MTADRLLIDIASYVTDFQVESQNALDTAALCLADSLGCAIRALEVAECVNLLGPIVPGTVVPNGARVPGTDHRLDPVAAAFNIGSMIRWLDYNDTWLAAEWGHPSDNIGAILAVAQYADSSLTIGELLPWIVKAYEIQGVMALENSFNRLGLDHVLLVKVASGAVAAGMLGATQDQVIDVLSNIFIDNGPLRTYRHFPNTGSRKSWAAGDAGARGVQLALMVMRGAMGYRSALTAKGWGFSDVVLDGGELKLGRALGSYVIENILFKVSFPAEFHAQTAVECGFALRDEVAERIDQVARIHIETQESAMRIIDKTGPLTNAADRDHCLQYMTACALLYGELTPYHYTDQAAADPRIDRLRELMVVTEEPGFSVDYMDPNKRSIGNAVTVSFSDGTASQRVAVEYPIGHPRRRNEAIPLLYDKLRNNLHSRYTEDATTRIVLLLRDHPRLAQTALAELLEQF